jgi:hypothetical protein
MHQERNVAESIISMCLDVTGFSKDNMNERKDLAALCDRPLLEVKTNAKGNLTSKKCLRKSQGPPKKSIRKSQRMIERRERLNARVAEEDFDADDF